MYVYVFVSMRAYTHLCAELIESFLCSFKNSLNICGMVCLRGWRRTYVSIQLPALHGSSREERR